MTNKKRPPMVFKQQLRGIEVQSSISQAVVELMLPFVEVAMAKLEQLPVFSPVASRPQLFTAQYYLQEADVPGSSGVTKECWVRTPDCPYTRRQRTIHELCHGVMRRGQMEHLPKTLKHGFCDGLGAHRWSENGKSLELGDVECAKSTNIEGYLVKLNTILQKCRFADTLCREMCRLFECAPFNPVEWIRQQTNQPMPWNIQSGLL